MATKEETMHPKTKADNDNAHEACRLTPCNIITFIVMFCSWFFFGFITSLHTMVLYCWRRHSVFSIYKGADKQKEVHTRTHLNTRIMAATLSYIYLCIYLGIYLCIYVSIYVSIYLSIYLSIYVYII